MFGICSCAEAYFIVFLLRDQLWRFMTVLAHIVSFVVFLHLSGMTRLQTDILKTICRFVGYFIGPMCFFCHISMWICMF